MDSALSTNGLSRTSPIALSGLTLTRIIEFICLGGGSLLIMAFCFCLGNLNFLMRDDVRFLLAQCAAAGLLFASLFSYPHAMWSYRFAYQQGRPFVLRHSWELIGYPVLIIGLLTISALTWNTPITAISAIASVESLFSGLFRIDLNWSKYSSLGELLLASLLVLQIVMSGYHYGMQALGIAIACGEHRGYKLGAQEKKYLRFNLYALWLVNLLSGYTFLSILDNRCFGYRPIRFPTELKMAAALAFGLTVMLVLYKVVLPVLRQSRRLPPVSACLPIISVWLWLQPFCQPFGFQAGVVPLAHGLQYLYFSARAEVGGFDQTLSKTLSKNRLLQLVALTALFAALVGSGYLAYKYVPVMLDGTAMVKNMAPNFFILAAYIFFNTHHFMIDAVIWRGDSRLRPMMPALPAD
ncbi:MAG: hypothetical protein JSS83_27225 [Cyanobacteria bacterium SZAS LIN-3]|nr:hypothetical protein [Cyanobacteria bacterium SZAS LIN-3]MBS2005717.1 hypothetical protein [Cyanobacteria bacterium SZAS TMP-1]